jgi:hypothetical protein
VYPDAGQDLAIKYKFKSIMTCVATPKRTFDSPNRASDVRVIWYCSQMCIQSSLFFSPAFFVLVRLKNLVNRKHLEGVFDARLVLICLTLVCVLNLDASVKYDLSLSTVSSLWRKRPI